MACCAQSSHFSLSPPIAAAAAVDLMNMTNINMNMNMDRNMNTNSSLSLSSSSTASIREDEQEGSSKGTCTGTGTTALPLETLSHGPLTATTTMVNTTILGDKKRSRNHSRSPRSRSTSPSPDNGMDGQGKHKKRSTCTTATATSNSMIMMGIKTERQMHDQQLQQQQDKPTFSTASVDPKPSELQQQQEHKEEYVQLSTEQIHSLIDNVDIPSYEIVLPISEPVLVPVPVPISITSETIQSRTEDCINPKQHLDMHLQVSHSDVNTDDVANTPCKIINETIHTSENALGIKHYHDQGELEAVPLLVEKHSILLPSSPVDHGSTSKPHKQVPLSASTFSSIPTKPIVTKPIIEQESIQIRTLPEIPLLPSSTTNTTTTNSTNAGSKNLPSKNSSSGRWTNAEHVAFLAGLKIHGREWKKVAQNIPTRTSAQIRSHAQKYFAKLARDEEQQANMWLSSNDNAAGAGVGSISSNLSVSPGRVGLEQHHHDKILLPPSVLERVDKILQDPKGAQLEVEETLRRLRDRYNELNQKISQRQAAKKNGAVNMDGGMGVGGGGFVNYNNIQDVKESIATFRQKSDQYLDRQSSRKQNERMMTPMIALPQKLQQQQQNQRINEQPVENASETYAAQRSQQNTMIPHRHRLRNDLLASKELIALHVLGGELYRSGSRESLSSCYGQAGCDDTNFNDNTVSAEAVGTNNKPNDDPDCTSGDEDETKTSKSKESKN